MTYQEKLPKKN